MKTIKGSCIITVAMLFLASAVQLFAVEGLGIRVQSTNIVLTWPSSSGNIFLIENETNLNTGLPWTQLTNYLRAAENTNLTKFTNAMLYPTNLSSNGGSNGGVLMPGGTNNGSSGTNIGMRNWSETSGFYRVFNVSPVAPPTFLTVDQDTYQNQLDIFKKDYDPNDDYFFISNLVSPLHGSIDYSLDASTFQYTPDNGFFGMDSFTYSITNLHGGQATAVVTVFVNQTGNNPPSANDVALTLQTNVYTATFNAITNSSDPDGDTITLFALTTPHYGTVTNDSLGNITYTRNPAFFGNDTFTYIVTDGKGGYFAGNALMQQVDTSGAGIPDQWLVKYGMDVAIDNSQNDQDGDGLSNLAEYQLGTNPDQPDNPLNLPTLTNGISLSGVAQLPLIGINPTISAPAVSLFVNNSPAANSFLSQAPDGMWLINWDTTYLTNGTYSVKVGFQSDPNGFLDMTYGEEKTVIVTNQLTFDQLTSQFTSFLLINATVAMTNANYAVYLYDENGNPLVYASGSTTNGTISLYWDLTDGNGTQLSYGNVQAVFQLSPSGSPSEMPAELSPSGPPSGTPIVKWFLKESGVSGTGFVAAWGWDSYGYSFNNNHNLMVANGVIDIVGNPADYNPYIMAPSQNVPLAGLSFRYNSESDKQTLIAAIQQNSCFFWIGHGNLNSITGNQTVSHIGAPDIAKALSNLSYMSSEKHPKTDQHPYKLAVLNACETYAPLWAGAFGIPFSTGMSTNIVLEYQYTGRTPRAFVGWTNIIDVPGGGDVSGVAHAEYGNALAVLWADWMGGYPLNYCLDDFAETATGFGFRGQDSWMISGCYDLKRTD